VRIKGIEGANQQWQPSIDYYSLDSRCVAAAAGANGAVRLMTTLSRLHGKGVLDRQRLGTAYAYAPVDTHAAVTARRMRRLLDNEQDHASVLVRFVDDLAPDDERLLGELIARSSGDAG
jgi:predicted transcriptional regulator